MASKRGGARPGAGRPSGTTGEARPQNQLRAHKDEWELIKRFADLVKGGYKDGCLKLVEELEKSKE